MIVMRSKYLSIVLPLLAITTSPATAQDIVFAPGTGQSGSVDVGSDESYDGGLQPVAAEADDDFIEMADKMADPRVQDGVSAAVERATGAMMNLPIGRFAEAIERTRPGTVGRRIRPDSTIADVAGADSRYLPEQLGDGSRQMMGMMSGFARAMAEMMPEFERMGREMEDSFRAAKAEARVNRY
jgi:hypothetical protein